MKTTGHLWAVGYNDAGRAPEVRDEVARLADKRCLVLLDTAVAVRHPDGSFTLDGEPFTAVAGVGRGPLARLVAALALAAPPLTGAAVGAMQRTIGSASAVGIGDDFVGEVGRLMKPGTSALFVLDRERDLEEILQGIRGLGGTVLKTNVDLERAQLIQSALSDPCAETTRTPEAGGTGSDV
jgi:uncharacterized membrane protein